MGSVYRNGLCNLAATAAVDANGGLLHIREFSILQDCHIECSWNDKRNSHWRVRSTTFPKSQLLDGPFLSRGWVIQERIMSRRILHFGLRQMFWECHWLNVSETYIDGIPNFRLPTIKAAFAIKPEYQALDETREKALKRRQFWYDILSRYTHCRLTREEDKLVAISGIAKAFQASFGRSEYGWIMERAPHLRYLYMLVSSKRIGKNSEAVHSALLVPGQHQGRNYIL